MNQPLLTIVIVNYNYGRFLEEAIRSVLSQSCQDFEIIIIDGGSTDNSVEIIKKYAGEKVEGLGLQGNSKISYWVSEPDTGQSNAFNKGFAKARGRFLTWLNADDVMLPGTIAKLKTAAEKHPECEWFVGGCFWLDPEMRIINCGRGRSFSEIRYREGNVSVWGPSSFFTKRLLDAVGGVDERFHYAMDSNLWLRFASKAGARYMPFCDYAWGLRLHPDAKMSGHNFTPDGKLDTQRSNEDKLKTSKHHAQMVQESQWQLEYFTPRKSSRVSHLMSVSWGKVLLARIDLKRFDGRHYMEFFK